MALTAKAVVDEYLRGSYPMTRDELVDRAQREGADPSILSRIAGLPDQRFGSPAAVEEALADER
jgi:hypothetical protein